MYTNITKVERCTLSAAVALLSICCTCGHANPTPAREGVKPFQRELLDIAFCTASKIPVYPHIKDRSRAQALVVRTCLQLGLAEVALDYIPKVKNWRRGLCYADLAFCHAKRGDDKNLQLYLKRAAEVATDQDLKKWRRDRIRIRIAQTYTLLGKTEKAGQFSLDVEESESGKVASAKAMVADEAAFDEQIAALDKYIAAGVYDITKNALGSYTQLFERFYCDPEKRLLVEKKVTSQWGKMPLFVRIELMMQLARSALDHGDKTNALSLVRQAQAIMDSAEWPLEPHIKLTSKLAAIRWRAGDAEKAVKQADAVLSLFEEHGNKIVNIYRAAALRPLAEAYAVMHDRQAALSVYKLAVEEGTSNPNSRPRAEDISATCCSMAMHGVEPDEGLWAHIRQINRHLSKPW